MKHFLKFVNLLLVTIQSCSLPSDSGPLPRHINDYNHKPTLSVFGVLRNTDKNSESLIKVERSFSITEQTKDFNSVIDSATVSVFDTEDSISYSFYFIHDSVMGGIYKSQDFIPDPGHTYEISVEVEDFSTVKGVTTVPLPVKSDSVKWSKDGNSILFQILDSELLELYDIYVVFENNVAKKRMIGNKDPIVFNDIDEFGDPLRVEIYLYDNNLSRYLQEGYKITPNEYSETVTYVEGGYGCFGSVSKTAIKISE